jgi:hypothetical protein
VTINPKDIAPVLVLTEKLATLPFDGVTTSFALLSLTGLAVTAGEVTDLHVVVDGVEQDPGIDFVLDQTGQFIEFIYPPEADAKSFIIYYAKSQIGFLSVVEHDWTMTGDGTTQNPLSVILASEDVPGLVNVPAGSALTLTLIPAAPPFLPEAALGLAVAQPADIVTGTDDVFPVTSLTLRGVMGDDVANMTTAAKEVVPAINELDAGIANLNNIKVDRAGDSMTGPLYIPILPTSPDEVTNKQYVDEQIAANSLYQGVWHVAQNDPDLTPAVMIPLNGWSWIAQTIDPNAPEVAPPGLPGISGLSIDSGDRVLWDAGIAAYAVVKGSSLSIQEARAAFVEIAGDRMTGNLSFTAGQGVYFSDLSGVYRSSFGPLTLQEGNGGEQPQIANVFGMGNRDIIDTVNGDARYVIKAGDTMAGPLLLSRDAQLASEATTKNYVDTLILLWEALKVNRAGDTMTGSLILPAAPPTLALEATNKIYVDSAITNNALWKGVYLPSLNFPDLNPASMNPQDGWTWFIQTQDPNLPEVVPPNVPGLSGQSVDSGWIVWWNEAARQYNLTKGPSLSMSTALATFVNLAGDTMTGDLNFPSLAGVNFAGTKLVSSGYVLYIQKPPGDVQPQILNNAGTAANDIIDASGGTMNGALRWPSTLGVAPPDATGSSVGNRIQLWDQVNSPGFGLGIEPGNMWFNTSAVANGYKFYVGASLRYTLDQTYLTCANDGQGIAFNSGGLVYKKVGTGMTLRRHSNNTEWGIENNDGSNRQNILTAATGVQKTGDTMTGTLSISSGNFIVNNGSIRSANNQGVYADGNSNTSASNGFVVRGSNGSEFCRWYADAVGYNGPAEARAHCATWNGGWSFQDCWYTVVNSPPTLYVNGIVSCQSLTQRSSREDKRDIRDVSGQELQSAWDALRVRRFRWKDTIPLGENGAPLVNPSPPPPQPERLGFMADELPEAVVAYAAPGSSDPAKQIRVREGWDVGDMLALCVAKVKELEAELESLKRRVNQ